MIDSIQDFFAANGGVSWAVGWSFVIIAMVEPVKPFVKRFVRDRRTSKMIVRLLPFVFGLITGPYAAPIVVEKIFGETVKPFEAVFIGLGAGLAAQGLYSAIEDFKIVQVLKLRTYRFFGVTVAEVNESELGLDGDSLVEVSYADDEND